MNTLQPNKIVEGALMFLQRVNLQASEAHSFVTIVEGLKAMLASTDAHEDEKPASHGEARA